jgi:hypothetical protein
MMRVCAGKDLLIKLEQVDDGVRVLVVDEGEEWYLLHLSEKGIELYEAVPASTGIALDDDGKMVVREETR